MYQYRKRKPNKRYQIRKSGVKDEFIDKQILAIHRAIVDKILANPALIESIRAKIDERQQAGKMRYGEYITWVSLLEMIDEPEEFRKGVLEDSPQMKKYRRKTPLTGILTEEERQQALANNALGTLPNMDYLFN